MKIPILTQHQHSPYHLGRPHSSTVEIPFSAGTFFLKIDLEDATEIVRSCWFDMDKKSPWVPYFSLYCSYVEGLPLELALTTSWEDLIENVAEFFPSPVGALPFQVFLLAYRKYKGIKSWQEWKDLPATDTLICRCFGVTKTQLQSYFKTHPDAGIKEVGTDLQAGAGCTSCLEDLEELLPERRHFSAAKRPRYTKNNWTPFQLMEQIHTFLSTTPACAPWTLSHIEGMVLHLNGKGSSQDKQFLAKELAKKFALDFKIFFHRP